MSAVQGRGARGIGRVYCQDNNVQNRTKNGTQPNCHVVYLNYKVTPKDFNVLTSIM